jgi:hypothetical protein
MMPCWLYHPGCNNCPWTHLEEVINLAVCILWRLADGVPHLVHVLTQHLHQLAEWGLGLVTDHKQQHCAAPVGLWSKQLQVDLHATEGRRIVPIAVL